MQEPALVQEPYSLIRANPCPIWCLCPAEEAEINQQVSTRTCPGHQTETLAGTKMKQAPQQVGCWALLCRWWGKKAPVRPVTWEPLLRMNVNKKERGKQGSLCWLRQVKGEMQPPWAQAHTKAKWALRAHAGACGRAVVGGSGHTCLPGKATPARMPGAKASRVTENGRRPSREKQGGRGRGQWEGKPATSAPGKRGHSLGWGAAP